MEDLKEEYPGETARYLPGYKKICGDKELARQKRLLNPLNYIGKEKTAPYYRIRGGGKRCGHFADCDHDSCPETDGMWKDQ